LRRDGRGRLSFAYVESWRQARSFLLGSDAGEDAVNVNRGDGLHALAANRCPVTVDRKTQAERLECSQQQADRSPRLSLFDVDNPFAADANPGGQFILAKAEAAPPVADSGANI